MSFCAVIVFANLFYENILSFLLCYISSSELIDYHVETFFPKMAHTWKNPRAIYIHSKALSLEVPNRKKYAIKIILINGKTETQLQQTAALRFSSLILTITGKSDFQFSKFYNINRALEPNITGSEHATMIRINQNKF